jgi:hypothetical protein
MTFKWKTILLQPCCRGHGYQTSKAVAFEVNLAMNTNIMVTLWQGSPVCRNNPKCLPNNGRSSFPLCCHQSTKLHSTPSQKPLSFKPLRKSPHVTRRRKYEDNIKMDFTKLYYEGGGQMKLTQNHIQWLALEFMILNPLVSNTKKTQLCEDLK